MRRALVVLSIFSFLLAAPLQLWADTEGPNNPATAVDATGVGTVVWSNPTNVFTSNNSRAVAALTNANDRSHYIKATNFSFTLTDCTSIDGILLEIERSEGSIDPFADVADEQVKLVKAGVIEGVSKANPGLNWPSSDAVASYGGSSDLWSTSWTCAQITASNFGGAVSADCDCGVGETEDARVDHMKITVTFTVPSPAAPKLLITQTRRAGRLTLEKVMGTPAGFRGSE